MRKRTTPLVTTEEILTALNQGGIRSAQWIAGAIWNARGGEGDYRTACYALEHNVPLVRSKHVHDVIGPVAESGEVRAILGRDARDMCHDWQELRSATTYYGLPQVIDEAVRRERDRLNLVHRVELVASELDRQYGNLVQSIVPRTGGLISIVVDVDQAHALFAGHLTRQAR